MHLSDHFTIPKLLRFTLPAIGTMVFTSIYAVVDGLFVSNYVGKTSFAAITIIFPLLSVLAAAGFMFGAGGSSLVGKRLGQGKKDSANATFSLLAYTTAATGILLAIAGFLLLEPVASFLGATGETLEQCLLYGQISLLSLPAFMLQFFFQALFVTAEKAQLGFLVTCLAGLSNILLDAILILVADMGLMGAAIATALSECLGGIIPILYFARRNASLLALTKPSLAFIDILRAAANGSSEFLINIAYPLLMSIYTSQLLSIAGENGVAAFGVLLYVAFIFSSLLLGYATGSAPIVSYNYGARRRRELAGLFRKSLTINLCAGSALSALAFLAKDTIADLFVGYDPALCAMTVNAIAFYAPVFLLSATNIFGSSFFTAINNGSASASISAFRSLLFGVPAVLLLPRIAGLDGVWIAWACAEAATLPVTIFLFCKGLPKVIWHSTDFSKPVCKKSSR
ncbi:MAG: hypothetical protein IJU76_15020 [Desulfovibrionaceae bacterium]|nr:hypothetical protein [Desulfovibrionaceae bacterium]